MVQNSQPLSPCASAPSRASRGASPPQRGSRRRPHSSGSAAVWFRVMVRSYLHGMSSRNARFHPFAYCADAQHPTRAPGARPRAQAYRAAVTCSNVLWRPLRGGGSQSSVYPHLTITSTSCSQARREVNKLIQSISANKFAAGEKRKTKNLFRFNHIFII
jgi:hypothetical protein